MAAECEVPGAGGCQLTVHSPAGPAWTPGTGTSTEGLTCPGRLLLGNSLSLRMQHGCVMCYGVISLAMGAEVACVQLRHLVGQATHRGSSSSF